MFETYFYYIFLEVYLTYDASENPADFFSETWSFRRSFPFFGVVSLFQLRAVRFLGEKVSNLTGIQSHPSEASDLPKKMDFTFLPSKVKKLPLLRKVTKTFLKSQAEKTPGFSASKKLMRNNWLRGKNPWLLDLSQTARFHCLFGTWIKFRKDGKRSIKYLNESWTFFVAPTPTPNPINPKNPCVYHTPHPGFTDSDSSHLGGFGLSLHGYQIHRPW